MREGIEIRNMRKICIEPNTVCCFFVRMMIEKIAIAPHVGLPHSNAYVS